MILVLIVGLSVVCAAAGAYCAWFFAATKSPLGLAFTVVWIMHYVVGNGLTLLSRHETFGLIRFEQFEVAYLAALAIGLYFLVVYAALMRRFTNALGPHSVYRREVAGALQFFAALGVVFGLLLVQRVGIGEYFSPELAFFRARLGEHAGAGVGVYYYLATLLIPATLLLGGYAIDHPRRGAIAAAALALIASTVLFVPLGGRGRVMNLFLVLGLCYFIRKDEYRLRRFLTLEVIAAIAAILVIAYVWGVIREDPLTEVGTDSAKVLRGLAVDMTRLNSQSFVLDRYPLLGNPQSGGHYVESLLGPFVKFLPFDGVGMIQELSARWYHDTIGGVDVMSAISPSFIGELYINFGLVGLMLAPHLLFGVLLVVRQWMDCRHPLSLAVIIYFYQFNIFHGGVYQMFDILVVTLPVLFLNRFLGRDTQGAAASSPAATRVA